MATQRVTCKSCNGAGRTGSEYYDSNGNLRRKMCSPCNGVGKVTVTVQCTGTRNPRRR